MKVLFLILVLFVTANFGRVCSPELVKVNGHVEALDLSSALLVAQSNVYVHVYEFSAQKSYDIPTYFGNFELQLPTCNRYLITPSVTRRGYAQFPNSLFVLRGEDLLDLIAPTERVWTMQRLF